jgi:hypothetical protein
MNDNDKRHTAQCGACGGLIDEGEDREEIVEDGEVIAYIHLNCA